ncbi:protein tyrosine phosphatase [Lactobacillus psittaci DSM 15354]|uniref:Protein tyrosine phosphatase n=1 Tax=Lactobacillus psittaci DSM 15354 TaxID=1122152 RepID=A0A0R1S2B7_9LACO|nr:protein tyrosine phosphatase [Lactobacillus psittaci DSM 15354]
MYTNNIKESRGITLGIEFTNQLIDIVGGRNFRELGGYETISGKKIKYHKLLRTGNLANLTNEDLKYLTNYGVKYDIDFRTKREQDNEPDRVPEGASYEFTPVFSDDLTNSSKSIDALETESEKDPNFGFDHMLLAYDDMIHSQTAKEAYRRFFELLLSNKNDNEVVLFHCTAGKDRTGFGAILLLASLGVPLSKIREDYLLTNITTQDFVENLLNQEKAKGKSENILQSIRDIQTVHPEYFDFTIKRINEDFESINNYLRSEMKLSSADIMDLRQIYLA